MLISETHVTLGKQAVQALLNLSSSQMILNTYPPSHQETLYQNPALLEPN